MDLETYVLSMPYEPAAIAARADAIHASMLAASPRIDRADFTRLGTDDLARLFDLYDERCFGGRCRQRLQETSAPLSFRISSRMTRAGGKTTRLRPRGGASDAPTRYEIAISTTLLGHTFRGEERSITVSGLECRDRLQALQRVFEHELIHLVELLVWETSRCTAPRFHDLARRIFGHLDVTHDMVTPLERAARRFGIAPGDRVAFSAEGTRHEGVVNRITQRATVLVEDRAGPKYSDGRRYAKFYVPLRDLEKIERTVS